MLDAASLDVALAVGHHLLIFALFAVLVAELILVRPVIDLDDMRLVQRLDLAYGLLAAAILGLGICRAIFAAKGWAYYQHNAFFWAKIATFLLIGALSVLPTLRYVGWTKRASRPVAAEIASVRRILWAELALFALLPIFAAAMARGYGADML